MSRDRVDIAIVGGGIIGMSVAYQVARRSPMSVAVFEKGVGLGDGSTGGSSGITRQRYTTTESIRIARDGNRIWRNWGDYVGSANPNGRFHPVGVLWMVDDDPAKVAEDFRRMAAEGVDVAELGADDLAEAFPALSTCMAPFDLTGEVPHECRPGDRFLLERDAGFFDPTGALLDLAIASSRVGVDIRLDTQVSAIHVDRNRVTGVSTTNGTRTDAGVVVNAAGPWCNRINAMAGLELTWDLVPTRVQVVYRDLPDEVPRPIPVVCDGSSGIYFRPEARGAGVILGSILGDDEREEVDPDDYVKRANRSFIDTKIHGLHHRIPSLPHRGIPTGMASLYTINRQDVLPVVGPTPVDGFIVANGFSGHGFKESQVVGSMLAQWLTGTRVDDDTDVPLSFLSVGRQPVAIGDHSVLA
ncbi:MAG: FAD-binding oxidoreductase [Acidimicrobiia bacterium]|nr:FAD-binding oxidoreductase [Acidimicrobiia bacterium]